jgi:hypothetical protein
MEGTLDPEFLKLYTLFMLHVFDAAKKGREVRWGRANAKSAALLFRSLLGAAGFYEPVTTIDHDPDRAKVARKWASRASREKYGDDRHPKP